MFEVALSKKEIQRLHNGAWLAVDSADKITLTWSDLKQK